MFLVLFHRALHWCLQPLNPQLDPLWKCWYPCSHECLVISSSSTTLQHIHAYTPSCTCTEPSFLFCSQRVLKQLDSASHSSFFSWNSSAGTLCPKTTWKSSRFFWLCTSCAKSKEHPLTIRCYTSPTTLQTVLVKSNVLDHELEIIFFYKAFPYSKIDCVTLLYDLAMSNFLHFNLSIFTYIYLKLNLEIIKHCCKTTFYVWLNQS